jgi:hypothetical protein
MSGINKEIFLEGRKCLTLAWLRLRQGEKSHSEADQFRLEQGAEIGRLARLLFPKGILVTGKTPFEASRLTKSFMADKSISVLFEATFHINDYTAKADILIRSREGWKLIEVKSSLTTNDKKKLDELVDDLAYTTMVLTRSKTKIERACLLLMSPAYRKFMDVNRLFVEIDMTDDAKKRLALFKHHWKVIRQSTLGSRRPTAKLNPTCKACEFFPRKCLGKGVRNPITDLPRIGKKIPQLRQTLSIKALPQDFPLSVGQRRIADCVRQNKEYRAATLLSDLEKVIWPAYYLDFETTKSALPLFPEIAPYEQIVTQYSIHRCSRLGTVDSHFEFLANPDRDDRLPLTKKLLKDLGNKGTIIVYSDFEKRVIQNLAMKFRELATSLNGLIKRLFDLLDIMEEGYYHPGFRGSYSIKNVLPVMIAEMSYGKLEIRDGAQADTCFARMALGHYSQAKKKQARENLLEYCKQDTIAMIRIHEKLYQISRSDQAKGSVSK